MLSKLFSFFNKKQKKSSDYLSVLFLHKKIDKFTEKSLYNTRDLNHFESLYGLILLKKQEDLIEYSLNALLKNINNSKKYKLFISKILLSTFKTKDTCLILKCLHTLSKHHIHFYKNDEGFKTNIHKIFFISMNSSKDINSKLMSIVLNSDCFSWIIKTFSFENLLEPSIYKAVYNQDYGLYNSIIKSLTIKANYYNGDIIKNSSIIALENNYLDFFENTYSVDIYCKRKQVNTNNISEFIFSCFFKFVNENKFEAANNILNLKKEMNNSTFNLLSSSKYSIQNENIISALKSSILHDKTFLKTFIFNIKEEINNYYYDIEVLNDFNYKYLLLLNNSNLSFEEKKELFNKSYFMPDSNVLIDFFKKFYSVDNKFLNFIYNNLHYRVKNDLSNCIDIIKTKEKIKDF
mgnify:CR=1 FL=1